MGQFIMLLGITINLNIYHLGVINYGTNFARLGQNTKREWEKIFKISKIFDNFQ